MIRHDLRVCFGAGMGNRCALTYDPATPWLVTFLPEALLDPSNVWAFDRQMLARGLQSRADVGDGDVRLRREGDSLVITLANQTESAEGRAWADQVMAFLADTYRLVPAGTERINLDAELEDLLTGGAR